MKRVVGLLLVLAATILATAQQPLQIYVIDPEGGKAALWIAPSGETVLIDTGNPVARGHLRRSGVEGANRRRAGRRPAYCGLCANAAQRHHRSR